MAFFVSNKVGVLTFFFFQEVTPETFVNPKLVKTKLMKSNFCLLSWLCTVKYAL